MKKRSEKKKMSEEVKGAGVELLGQALDSFKTASESLGRYYKSLEKRVHELNVELEEERNYLNNILQSLPVGMIAVDLDERITNLNRCVIDMTGRGFEELIGRPVREAVPLSSWNFLEDDKDQQWDRDTKVEVKLDKEYDGELALLVSSSFIRDCSKRISGSLVILQDITELKILKEQTDRNRRLVAMGEMAAGIAHEMRNPLGSIELFTSILKEDLSKTAKSNPELLEGKSSINILEYISSGVKTLSSVLSNMLLFTTQPKPSMKSVRISNLLTESILLGYPMIEANSIEVERKGNMNGLAITGDEELLKQVFLNIILNSSQAMSEGGKLTIDARLHGTNFVEISFADTGEGISKGALEKIFDPFFTTKERGTGLGLTIVNNIVKAHGGIIDVESNPGKGTTFRLTFPLSIKKETAESRMASGAALSA